MGTVDCARMDRRFSMILLFLGVVAIGTEVPVIPSFWGVDFRRLHRGVLVAFWCHYHRNGRFCHD